MKQKSSFGKTMLRNILIATTVVFAITMFILTKYSFDTAQENTQQYAQTLAGKYAGKIQNSLDQATSTAKSIASHFEKAAIHGAVLNKNATIEYLKSILKHNEAYVGVWWNFIDGVDTFEKGSPQVDPNAYDKNGKFSPYVSRSSNGFEYQLMSAYDEKNEWISGPKKAGKPYITAPYMYPVGGKEVLMASVSIPMYKDGKFIGATGIDLTLSKFSELLSKIKVYETGYSFIVDNNGIIVGHPMKELLGKSIGDVSKNDADFIQMVENNKNNKSSIFNKVSKLNNVDSTFFAEPFSLNAVDVNWGFVINAPVEEYLQSAFFIRNFSILATILSILVIAIFIYLSVRKLNINLALISNGLEEFFVFLNTRTSSTKNININSNCEFGVMAYSINENVAKVKTAIEEDNRLINEVKNVVEVVSQRRFDKRIQQTTSTESLNELKELLNNMLNKLETQVGKDMNILIEVLDKYTNSDFTPKLDPEHSGNIGQKIIELNRMITHMLQNSQKDGLSLRESAEKLSSNMDTLSKNATKQAASLEETAASIQEITGNIEQTNGKAKQMQTISNETKTSASLGKQLANDTVTSMDEINNTVHNINDAILVIDQIAFQTNILSLNAAVEAATAGEAGKGFAVVAQEVRNLASRSAEAAKEIKDLVEDATSKANDGKEISTKMIDGFSTLESKIVDTSKLIEDVTAAAQEQSQGMRQISDAVTMLDTFTQENASVADETNNIARETNSIAQVVVDNVDKNNFDGKDISHKSSQVQYSKPKAQQSAHKAKETIKAQSNNDEWENF